MKVSQLGMNPTASNRGRRYDAYFFFLLVKKLKVESRF